MTVSSEEIQQRIETAIGLIRSALQTIRDDVDPLQILVGNCDGLPDRSFTAGELSALYGLLTDAVTQLHFAARHSFRIEAVGRYGDALDTFMPTTVMPEVQDILKDIDGGDG